MLVALRSSVCHSTTSLLLDMSVQYCSIKISLLINIRSLWKNTKMNIDRSFASFHFRYIIPHYENIHCENQYDINREYEHRTILSTRVRIIIYIALIINRTPYKNPDAQ